MKFVKYVIVVFVLGYSGEVWAQACPLGSTPTPGTLCSISDYTAGGAVKDTDAVAACQQSGGCKATSPTITYTQVPASGLATYIGSKIGVFGSTVACDGSTDVTTTMQSEINGYSNKGGGVYFVPQRGCVVGGTADLVLPNNIQIRCSENAGGFWPSGNYVTNANFLVDPSNIIATGSTAGGKSGIYGCVIVKKGLLAATSLRTAITAANAFAGTAFVCQAGATDVELIGNLIIGFATGVQSSCDRFNFIRNRGDDTNFLSLSVCNDTCYIIDDEAWPFVGNPYQGFPQTQTTNVTSATISGGTTLTLGFAAPATPFVTGDAVTLAVVGGITWAQYGRFSATVVDSTHISVTGTFSGTYTSGGTIYLSGTKRNGTGFLLVGTGGGPFVAGLVDYGHDTGIHYQNGSSTRCTRCWIDNDTSLANRDPVPFGLLLDGSSAGLVNYFEGFINTPGVALVKNDASILTVGPGSQLFSLNSLVGENTIRALAGSIVFDAANAFTDAGLGSGSVMYVGTGVTNIAINGGSLNGSTTFQSATPPCGLIVTNGTAGPCTYTPTYTGAAIAGPPLQAAYWIDANGKRTVFYSDSGHAVTGATSTQFSISMPSTATIGGVCTIGLVSLTFPASTTQLEATIHTGSNTAQFYALGNLVTTAVPGTALGNPDVLEVMCKYD